MVRKQNAHWLKRSLRYKKPSLPPPIKQIPSLPGQLSLPGMEGEAERNLPPPKRKRQDAATRRKRGRIGGNCAVDQTTLNFKKVKNGA